MARSKKTDTGASEATPLDADAIRDDTVPVASDAATASEGAPDAEYPLPEATPDEAGALDASGETVADGAGTGVDVAAGDPADETAPPVSPPRPDYTPPHSGGGFLAGLLGAALAIACGVGALWLSNPDLLRGKTPQPDLTPVTSRIDAQATDIAGLSDAVKALQAEDKPDAVDLTARLEAVEAAQATLSQDFATLRSRIETLEARPATVVNGGDEGTAAMRDELERQRNALEVLVRETRQRIESASAEAQALQSGAEAAARTAMTRAAMTRLQAALEAGGPYAVALDDLAASTGQEMPEALRAQAATGVPSLADLRTRYPDAARAALDASIRAGLPEDAGPMDRVGAFLRSQTGARSTSPRDGDDPDAVLSRAEAALAGGDLTATFAALDTLPEAGRAAMSDWRSAAETRQTALQAAATLAAALPAN